jgi:hypothetical protein
MYIFVKLRFCTHHLLYYSFTEKYIYSLLLYTSLDCSNNNRTAQSEMTSSYIPLNTQLTGKCIKQKLYIKFCYVLCNVLNFHDDFFRAI